MIMTPVIFSFRDVQSRFPNRKTYESYLARSIKEGKLVQVRKGLYALVDPSSGAPMANKFQIASRSSESAFLDYHLAMEYYGLAEQSFISDALIASETRFRPFVFNGLSYRCAPIKGHFGIQDRMDSEGVRVASIERILVDSAARLDRCGGFEELTKAISLIKDLHSETLLLLLRAADDAFLFRKVGYLLETYYQGSIPASFYETCLSYRTSKKYYFGAKVAQGVYIKKWGLIVPNPKENVPNDIF